MFYHMKMALKIECRQEKVVLLFIDSSPHPPPHFDLIKFFSLMWPYQIFVRKLFLQVTCCWFKGRRTF